MPFHIVLHGKGDHFRMICHLAASKTIIMPKRDDSWVYTTILTYIYIYIYIGIYYDILVPNTTSLNE